MDVPGFALTTGAGSGIGKACAKAFVAEGSAGVALLDINDEAILSILSYTVDVTDEEQVYLAINEAAHRFGRLDYVVKAAGVSIKHPAGAAIVNTRDWHHLLNVNLNGSLFVLRAAAQIMLTQELILSSVDESASLDYAKRRLRINAICPGYTETPMTMRPGTREEDAAAVRENVPMGRMADAKEIADGVLFLAGGPSSYVSGSALVVDAGHKAR